MAKKPTATQRKVSAAFHEVHEKVPASVKATGKTGEAKQAMMTAIALSKARAAGAKIPEKKSYERGGTIPSPAAMPIVPTRPIVPAITPVGIPAMHDGGQVPRTGLYRLRSGETVIPAPGQPLGMKFIRSDKEQKKHEQEQHEKEEKELIDRLSEMHKD